jgi:multidrug efflux pump subunit AcrB
VAGQEQAIRVLAGARDVKTLAETKIKLSGGRQVRLSDLGTVVDDASEQRSFGRLNGQPVVSFAIFRAKGSSEISVQQVVDKKLEALRKRYPGIAMTKIDDAVSYTAGNYRAAMETLIEGSALAVLVVFLFLKNMRATLIAAIALPLAAIPTFAIMSMLGFSLNLVSLLAITLATGILVDDAIVEIENIVRHMNMGNADRAALGRRRSASPDHDLADHRCYFAPVVRGINTSQFGLTVARRFHIAAGDETPR